MKNSKFHLDFDFMKKRCDEMIWKLSGSHKVRSCYLCSKSFKFCVYFDMYLISDHQLVAPVHHGLIWDRTDIDHQHEVAVDQVHRSLCLELPMLVSKILFKLLYQEYQFCVLNLC